MATQSQLEVELPAGGKLQLRNEEEVDLWDRIATKYKSEYQLSRTNDLVTLGIILNLNVTIFRAQQALNGMVPQTDAQGVPTGRLIFQPPTANEAKGHQKAINDASKEIRELEKSLGIDKRTRDAGGGENLAQYIMTLKAAGRQYGLHIQKRVKAYEEFGMELRWKIRVLRNGDEEDRAEHNISEETILAWAEQRLAELEQIDQQFAKTKQRIFAGRL
jgi:hypothetical protein